MEAFDSSRQPLPPATVIEPIGGWKMPDLRELWRYRDLAIVLARRDIVVRYQQAIVGLGWAVLQPLLLAGLFAFFLGLLDAFEAPAGIPYEVYTVSGMVMWIPFAAAINFCTLSTLQSSMLIDKVYFPRVLIPIAAVAPFAVDMLIGLLVAVAVGIGYGVYPDLGLLAAPFVIVLALLLAAGFGILFSALNVKYRDTNLAVGFILLAGLFVTPITYPYEQFILQFPDWVHPVYQLNPMVGVLEFFRWSLLGTPLPDGFVIYVPLVLTPVLLFLSALYFERTQRSFADVI